MNEPADELKREMLDDVADALAKIVDGRLDNRNDDLISPALAPAEPLKAVA